MKTSALVAIITAAAAQLCFAQAPADTSPEKAAVMASDRAFEAAYAKGDVAGLAAFFADDAEYTAEDGQTYSGKAAIEGIFKAAFLGNKGAKLAIATDSVRAITPDVVVQKGSTTVTEADGDTSDSVFTAIYAKKDGKWKISQLVETPAPVVSPNARLQELAWLIGEWEEADKVNNLTVRSQYEWARGGNFITRNVTVKRAGDTILEGWQIIGWDPVEERIRSWTFDSEGGYSEGSWTRAGERWLLRETGVAPDGSRTSADQTFNKLSNDRFAWDSANRTLNGDPQPSVSRIEINRVKGN